MMISEFKTLTGIHPSWALWAVINRVYNESKLDKHEWCKAYVENKDGMAVMIAVLADKEFEERARNHEIELKNEDEDDFVPSFKDELKYETDDYPHGSIVEAYDAFKVIFCMTVIPRTCFKIF